MGAHGYPANFLALTDGVSMRLDRNQILESLPTFWSPAAICSDSGARAVAKTCRPIRSPKNWHAAILVGLLWASSKQAHTVQGSEAWEKGVIILYGRTINKNMA